MPFDGTVAKFVKPEVFSLEGLVAWLEQQPAEQEYCWVDAGVCLWSKYGQAALDMADGFAAYCQITDTFHRTGAYWYADISVPRPHTYGAALSRARQLLATA